MIVQATAIAIAVMVGVWLGLSILVKAFGAIGWANSVWRGKISETGENYDLPGTWYYLLPKHYYCSFLQTIVRPSRSPAHFYFS